MLFGLRQTLALLLQRFCTLECAVEEIRDGDDAEGRVASASDRYSKLLESASKPDGPGKTYPLLR